MNKVLVGLLLLASSVVSEASGSLQFWKQVVQQPSNGLPYKNFRFQNPAGRTIYIKRCQILLYPGSYTEEGTLVGNLLTSSGVRLAYWSQIIEPGEYASNPDATYSPDWIEMSGSETLNVGTYSSGFGGAPTFFVVDIWYTTNP
jgi:hypothetical protein